jgi:hypothetical protein
MRGRVAKPAAGAKVPPRKRKFGLADLWRATLWGLSAALSVTIAAYAASTPSGYERMRVAFAEIHEIFSSSGVTPPRPLDAAEGRKLAETVRTLTADRDRLAAHLAKLERTLDDTTGSVARVEKAAQAAQQQLAQVVQQPPFPAQVMQPSLPAQALQQPSLPTQTVQQPSLPPQAAAAPPQPPAPATDPVPPEDVTASVSPPRAATSTPPQAPPPAPARLAFGLDLGSATSVDALRALWTTALRRHGALLDGLRPVVHVRERQPGVAEFHLLAGPIPNAAAAARYCATITASGAVCQPAPYEGQRLALR